MAPALPTMEVRKTRPVSPPGRRQATCSTDGVRRAASDGRSLVQQSHPSAIKSFVGALAPRASGAAVPTQDGRGINNLSRARGREGDLEVPPPIPRAATLRLLFSYLSHF